MPFEQIDVLDRWKQVMTTYGRRNNDIELLRKRTDLVFPVIEPILEKHGIPDDFLYVPVAESSLNGRAVSRMGAAGYWQLMPGTARDLGLKVGKRVDERYNLEKRNRSGLPIHPSVVRQILVHGRWWQLPTMPGRAM